MNFTFAFSNYDDVGICCNMYFFMDYFLGAVRLLVLPSSQCFYLSLPAYKQQLVPGNFYQLLLVLLYNYCGIR